MNAFIAKFAVENNWKQLLNVIQTSNQIPEKPKISHSDHKPQELKESKSKALLFQELEHVRPNNITKVVAIPQGVSLNDLKQEAIDRGKKSALAMQEMQVAYEKQEHVFLVKRLPTICNTLRSYCLIDKIYSVTLSNMISRLSSDFRISKVEVRKSLSLLTTIVPEYLTVFPPDDIVPVATLRINPSSEHPIILNKIQQYITNTVCEDL